MMAKLCTEDEFRRAGALGLRITIHVGDGAWGTTRPIVQLASRGVLADDTTHVDCKMLADKEYRLIGDGGGAASISPGVEPQMGHGFLAILKLMGAGVRPSLSIDFVTSIGGDMFGAMRALLVGTRAVVNDEAVTELRIVAAAQHTQGPRVCHSAARPCRGSGRQNRLAHARQCGRHRPRQHQQSLT
jgi:5-methylthioadenosine/S-adenosylhomocysteine deaminase